MKELTIAVLLAVPFLSNAQQYGAQWVMGGIPAIIDFRNDTVANQPFPNLIFDTFRTLANICDENGNLLYTTNGILIADPTGNDMEGDTGLSPCPYTTEWANEGLD